MSAIFLTRLVLTVTKMVNLMSVSQTVMRMALLTVVMMNRTLIMTGSQIIVNPTAMTTIFQMTSRLKMIGHPTATTMVSQIFVISKTTFP